MLGPTGPRVLRLLGDLRGRGRRAGALVGALRRRSLGPRAGDLRGHRVGSGTFRAVSAGQ